MLPKNEKDDLFYDVFDRGDHYEIVIDLRGFNGINVEGDLNDEEISVDTFKTVYVIDEFVDVSMKDFEREMNKGILVITLPKKGDEDE